MSLLNWFKARKIKTEGKSCEIECSTLMVDMGTFMCPNQCKELYKRSRTTRIPGKFIYYPGLNPAEKKLVEKYPKDEIAVFIQKTRAEFASDSNFPMQGLNDEGDAFRHFVWAGLLTKELGKEQVSKFLDAQEDNRLQPDNERIMEFQHS